MLARLRGRSLVGAVLALVLLAGACAPGPPTSWVPGTPLATLPAAQTPPSPRAESTPPVNAAAEASPAPGPPTSWVPGPQPAIPPPSKPVPTLVPLPTPGPTPVVKASETRVAIASGGAGGTYGLLAKAMAGVFDARVPGVVAFSIERGGPTQNLHLLDAKEAEIGLVQADVANYAWNGQEMWLNRPMKNFSAIASLFARPIQVVVRAASPARTLGDLKGQRIGVGAPASLGEANSREVLGAAGLDYRAVQPQFLPLGETMSAFLAGQVDAVILPGQAPNSAVQELLASGKGRLLPIEGEIAAAATDRYAFMVRDVIPARIYENQTADVKTVAIREIVVARNDLSPDLVYGLTKAIFEGQSDLAKAHPRGKDIARKQAQLGLTIPLHPGAERYLRSVGRTSEQ